MKRHEISRYLFTLRRSLGALATGPLSRAGRRELGEVALALGHLRHKGALPLASIESVTTPGPIELTGLDANDWNTTTTELAVIAAITRQLQPKRIFEFGTYDGRTTATMLLNAPPDAHAWTIDLAAEAPRSADPQPPTGARLTSDRRFVNRYTQLIGDSLKYDYAKFAGNVDLIFIDAGHSYECCRADSRNALRMRSPNGVILWHDYESTFPGVTKAIDEIAVEVAPSGLKVVHIDGCTVAMLR